MKYPVRCQIVDVTGMEVLPGIEGKTPKESKPHIGQQGLAERLSSGTVRITLDDGSVLYGHECWWIPLKKPVRRWYKRFWHWLINTTPTAQKHMQNEIKKRDQEICNLKRDRDIAGRC